MSLQPAGPPEQLSPSGCSWNNLGQGEAQTACHGTQSFHPDLRDSPVLPEVYQKWSNKQRCRWLYPELGVIVTVLAGPLQVHVGALADFVDGLSLAGNTLQGHDRDSSPLDEHLGKQEAPSGGLRGWGARIQTPKQQAAIPAPGSPSRSFSAPAHSVLRGQQTGISKGSQVRLQLLQFSYAGRGELFCH